MEESAGPGRPDTAQAVLNMREPELPLAAQKGRDLRQRVKRARAAAPAPVPEDAQAPLPYARQVVDESDIEAVAAVLRSSHLTQGPAGRAFEQALANVCGAEHGVAVNSGTAALFVAVRALGLGAGTVTIVPAVTFLATANAVTLNGGRVVFADVHPVSGLMTEETLQAALRTPGGRHAQAAIPVHLGGRLCDMEGLAQIARREGLTLIEDAAHALGSMARDSTGTEWAAGSCRFSAATCFSFHPAKTIAAGEAGAIVTADGTLARRLERDRNHGVTRDPTQMTQPHVSFDHDGRANPWSYEMDRPSLNFRLSDIHAALGLSQLKRLASFKERRRALLDHYRARLAPFYPLVQIPDEPAGQSPAWHLCAARIDFDALGVLRARAMRAMAEAGIQTQVHYIPLHYQPYYRGLNTELVLPGAGAYYRRTMSLPLHAGMTDADVARVTDALRLALGL